MDHSRTRGARLARRLPILLTMVIGLGACDNVEWGGLDMSVVRPPPTAGPVDDEIEAIERLPDRPILYHVTRQGDRATVVPVGEVDDGSMEPIRTGDDAEAFGGRFIAAFMREGSELTLFRNGRRAGTMIVDSAYVPTGNVCRPLPRAVGRVELAAGAGDQVEFLAMARTQAPPGTVMPGRTLDPTRRMDVVGNIMAERALRARGAQLPHWATARRQLQPFPVEGTQDLGFTATYLVGDQLQIGGDDQGYSLFALYTPQPPAGYDTAFVSFRSYPAEGKAAPRVIDFLDWSRDGQVELLLEVYGTRSSWFEAVGRVGDRWQRIFRDQCHQPGPVIPINDASADGTGTPDGQPTGAARPQVIDEGPAPPP
jgi:hypothetical protein